MDAVIQIEAITSRIFIFRGIKVILDRDLAQLYDVETKQMKRAVRRNISRFPEDFMFELSKEEFKILRRQIGTSSWGGTRYPLSSVAPHAGAWIETACATHMITIDGVAPHAGAWIEITKQKTSLKRN